MLNKKTCIKKCKIKFIQDNNKCEKLYTFTNNFCINQRNICLRNQNNINCNDQYFGCNSGLINNSLYCDLLTDKNKQICNKKCLKN